MNEDLMFITSVIKDLFYLLKIDTKSLKVWEEHRIIYIYFFLPNDVGESRPCRIKLQLDEYDKAMFSSLEDRKNFIISRVLNFIVENEFPQLMYLRNLE